MNKEILHHVNYEIKMPSNNNTLKVRTLFKTKDPTYLVEDFDTLQRSNGCFR